ncbi:lysM and putative peptidoglycan-binding domain-containing protein 4 isoform X1 [Falco peregrinus]|uniref:lysM and putative peptidoglycan-binding domain-containing protein 4 isoform X1 n=1 Tax=Falco peregrinus TaxID=8954 RepID=UPI00247B15EC|nr:lysM and putative peptidoglycan-binding domain-containing protein 4 isoform X1 [Falco peregrinus]XP_055670615.1 lysM and putative peptidoglycan-binding domain-containing protein 4 isoform X1 [Falco peregrinus]XP_055670622.1 lysM and putative peptidoglycan-binding domain-containing protein 4 isoform X1 [Falco peregrinus]
MRLNESRTRSFQAPVTIHNYPGRQVYVFPNGQSDSEESEEELNVMELRPRGKEQQRCSTSQDRAGDVVLLEREITEDDNLNKLALQYGCKVADIKRVNNFIREQDLYALKSIKIPVKPHGLLTENGRELKPLPTAPSQTGLTVLDLPEPDDGVSSSADGRHLSDYFRGIDKNIQDAVQAEVQLNTEYCMEALERPPPELGKQETSNGRLRCRAAEHFPWKAERLAARPPHTRRSRSWEHLSLQGLFSGERCSGAPQYAWGQRRFSVAGFKAQSCGL